MGAAQDLQYDVGIFVRVIVTVGSFIFVLGSVIFTIKSYVYTAKRSYSLSVDPYG